ncbi:MAG: Gfo/Idh/MocA family oxidoreductase [Oscillospiraceae bacterium]|nr:Gfo/Idh/MocA family oxidoreductase [Oscillospiraceae bacterium]
MKTKLKIALLGCGKQSEKHLSGLQQFEDIEIVLADLNLEAAKALAEKVQLSYVENPEGIFDDSSIEAVDICTPTPSHFPLIKSALTSGKHVFCEKPLCETLEEAVVIRDLEKSSGCHVLVGYIYRYAPAFSCASQMLAKGAKGGIGTPLAAFYRIGGRGNHQKWKHMAATGGGAISEMLVHMLDLAHWHLGPLTDIAVDKCAIKKNERVVGGETFISDAEDYIQVSCKGKDGCDISFLSDMISGEFIQYAEIQAEEGAFFGSIRPDIAAYQTSIGNCGTPAGRKALDLEHVNLYLQQMKAFVTMVRTGDAPISNTVEDSIYIMEYLKDIKEKAAIYV